MVPAADRGAGVSSGPHHHGESETGIYIVSGNPEFIYAADGHEVRLLTKPGDYIYIPPFVRHIESNANSDDEAVVVLRRFQPELHEDAAHVRLDGLRAEVQTRPDR